ncbi:MAG: hypothetical protein JKY56_26640 [Kofleriaceae bacterium]|nr:hypothetical protein [Kofleriaceae bacterium]
MKSKRSNSLSRIVGYVAMTAALLMGTSLVSSDIAHADKCSDRQDEADNGGKNYKTVIGPDGRKVFVIQKAFVVCGTVPRPNVIYVLQATAINYEWENLKQDFMPLIRKSVKKWPF